jgi:hypothetical protein
MELHKDASLMMMLVDTASASLQAVAIRACSAANDAHIATLRLRIKCMSQKSEWFEIPL